MRFSGLFEGCFSVHKNGFFEAFFRVFLRGLPQLLPGIFWKESADYQKDLAEHEDERSRTREMLRYARMQLQRLKKTNVSDLF